jgi:hypothetical protein
MKFIGNNKNRQIQIINITTVQLKEFSTSSQKQELAPLRLFPEILTLDISIPNHQPVS